MQHLTSCSYIDFCAYYVTILPYPEENKMLIKNLALYEDKYPISINKEGDAFFYAFDYDVRSYAINMEFQHFHQFYEFCILLSPKAVHLLEGQRYDIECFDIVGIRPNVLHRTYYPEGDPCRRLIIRFNIPLKTMQTMPELKKVFGIFNGNAPIFRFTPEINKEIYRPLNEIYMLGKNPDDISSLQIHLNFLEFLSLLYKHRYDNIYANALPDNDIEGKVYSITSYIHAHYGENLSLDSISSQFFISNYYLSHKFKDITGFTLTDYIHMTRIRNVQTMLLNTSTPITDISMQCGFTSFSQFNRVFRKLVGMSPSDYRRSKGAHGKLKDQLPRTF